MDDLIQGGVAILLVASCCRNRVKFWPRGLLGLVVLFYLIKTRDGLTNTQLLDGVYSILVQNLHGSICNSIQLSRIRTVPVQLGTLTKLRLSYAIIFSINAARCSHRTNWIQKCFRFWNRTWICTDSRYNVDKRSTSAIFVTDPKLIQYSMNIVQWDDQEHSFEITNSQG